MESFFPVQSLINTIYKVFATPAVSSGLMSIGMLLAGLFFVFNLYMGLVRQSGAGITEALIRAAFVGAMLANIGFILDAMIALHQGLAAIGEEIFQAIAGADRFHEVMAELNAARAAADAFVGAGPFGIIKAIPIIISIYIPLGIFMLFFLFALAVYNFVLFGSYLALGLAAILSPIWISFLISPMMQRFTFQWLQVVLHSALVVMLAKAAAGILGSLVVFEPILKYAASIRAAAEAGAWTGIEVGLIFQALIGLILGGFALLAIQGLASAFVGHVESVAGSMVALWATARMAPKAIGAVAGGAISGGSAAGSAMMRMDSRTGVADSEGGGRGGKSPGSSGVDRTFPSGTADADAERDRWTAAHEAENQRAFAGVAAGASQASAEDSSARGGWVQEEERSSYRGAGASAEQSPGFSPETGSGDEPGEIPFEIPAAQRNQPYATPEELGLEPPEEDPTDYDELRRVFAEDLERSKRNVEALDKRFEDKNDA